MGIAVSEDLVRLAEVVGGFATALGVLGLVVAWLSVRQAVASSRLQAFIYLHKYLSQDQLSQARKAVRNVLHAKPYRDWSEDDKVQANRVCSSYDQAGILISGKIVDKRSALVFLRSSWGDSICDQYEALREYLDDQQTIHDNGTGRKFFRHFGDLYALALKYRSQPQSK